MTRADNEKTALRVSGWGDVRPPCVCPKSWPRLSGATVSSICTHPRSRVTPREPDRGGGAVQWINRTSPPTSRPRAPRMHRSDDGMASLHQGSEPRAWHSAQTATCTLSPQRPRTAPTHGRRDGAPLGLTWGVRLTSNWRLTSPPGGALTPKTTAVHASNDAGCPSHPRRVSVIWWTNPG